MSMIVPFIMTIWTDSVLTFEYKGWLSHIREFEISCSMSAKDEIKFNGWDTKSQTSFRSPIYTISQLHILLSHHFQTGVLPDSEDEKLDVFDIFLKCIGFSKSNSTDYVLFFCFCCCCD